MYSTAHHTYHDNDTISDWLPTSTDSPLAPLWIAGVFTLATLVLAPFTLLIIATGVTFGPVLGFTYALGGSMVSAIVHYGLGRIAGKETVRWIAGSRLSRVQRQISRHGFLSVLFARIVPIAPFVIVNLVPVAIQVRVRDCVLGTLVCMRPGIAAIVLLEHQLQRAREDPGMGNITLLFGLAVLFAVLGWAFYRWYGAWPLRASS